MQDLPTSGLRATLLFEASWEVANKVGGIHTVLVGKAPLLAQQWGGAYLLIGPHLPHSTREWEEAPTLFADWREYFFRERGYRVYAGYWHVEGQRIRTLLVDFYPALPRRNEIFAELWEKFRVDSLHGGWDYVEPAIFGYAAGEVITSFCTFYYGEVDAVAHFHEWLTGAGVLYLQAHAPTITTLFTTHATVAGRAAGGELIPFAEVENWLRLHHLTSKHSLERAAWQHADATTTVSEHVSREAAHYLGRPADVITPNGWNPPGMLPVEKAQEWLTWLSKQWQTESPSFWLIHAGRPELENKGTLPLLHALSRYREQPLSDIQLHVLFALPSDSDGPGKAPDSPLWVSHILLHPEQDPLLSHLRALSIAPSDPIRIAYLPVYLEGSDGVVNLPYYALLAATDASAFPSRYEPWGYTPQESLGMGVPTLSSRQAGFGTWMQTHVSPLSEALSLIDYTAPDPPGQILTWLYRRLRSSLAQKELLRQEALRLSEKTRWHHFLPFYQQAYQIARTKAQARLWYRLTPPTPTEKRSFQWHRAFFLPALPDLLRPLRHLAYNLWWTWNPDAQHLFASLSPSDWELHENPVWLLNHLPTHQWKLLSENEEFLRSLRQVSQRFQTYMAQPLRTDVPRVAYLCMEYGLTRCLPFYSGGLGVLAGDYLKEASDQGYPLLAVGLLYRKGYFLQQIDAEGEQIAETPPLRFTDLPVEPVREADGRWLRLRLLLADQTLYLKVWQVHVGRIPLYLLDADLSENPPEMRAITAQLYTGDSERRLQQELILGFGTQALIEALQVPIDIFHYNEGHPAFHIVAHLLQLRREGLSLEEAQERVRAQTLFTTHTPVPAGHDAFPPDLLRRYIGPVIAHELGLRWEEFLQWGEMPGEPGKFSLTALALHFSARTNAVSQLHAQVSREMFSPLYPGYLPPELPIHGITNGVHVATWQASEWSRSKRSWETHQTLKNQLLSYLRRRLSRRPWPVAYLESLQAFLASTDENTLLLTFARRVATYKRHLLLFEYEGLADLLSSQPVRLIIAGKAHPQDEAGKSALRTLWRKSLTPPYKGRVLFVPDYDMQLARYLVQGSDVWLNLPVYGQEASGTSGMKASLNGVLHLSIPDGWWAEVPAEEAGGWTIPTCDSQDPSIRDAWEAVQLTYLLQGEVLPTYLTRDARGLPPEWIARMEKAQRFVSERFSLTRMLTAYENSLYLPLWERARQLTGEVQKQRTLLLQHIQRYWPQIEIKAVRIPPFSERAYPVNQPFEVEVAVENPGLPPEALRVEVVFETPQGKPVAFALPLIEPNLYRGELLITDAGVYHYAVRLYAWDPYLNERLWKWTKLI
ncbi:MAG: alpha-glucan family phosphorylase [Bacteroidia bacterium]|nr:alpha-glucan family phosphorylase [Bacteroidia bacterium]